MNDTKSSKIWFYIIFLPCLITLLGLTIVYTAREFQWGSELQIPVHMLLGLFFAEFTMVISGLGIVGFIKSKPKTGFIKLMGLLNVLIMITACIIGYNIFMTL